MRMINWTDCSLFCSRQPSLIGLMEDSLPPAFLTARETLSPSCLPILLKQALPPPPYLTGKHGAFTQRCFSIGWMPLVCWMTAAFTPLVHCSCKKHVDLQLSHPMWVQCWTSVEVDEPSLYRHRVARVKSMLICNFPLFPVMLQILYYRSEELRTGVNTRQAQHVNPVLGWCWPTSTNPTSGWRLVLARVYLNHSMFTCFDHTIWGQPGY